MKIGIYGGSFNPIHKGHVKIIEYVLQNKELDKLIVIPVGTPSHRDDFTVSGELRLMMARAACKDIDRVEVSDIEVRARGKSYTYETLMRLKEIYQGSDFYEIVGEDSADYLHLWRDYSKMVEETRFIVLKREEYHYEASHENIEVLESPLYQYSSTEVRRAVKEGRDISSMVPLEVEEIIERYRLYRGDENEG